VALMNAGRIEQIGSPVDRYEDLPANGAFILIDEASHQTAAAGMLR
jgi:sulfate adenylyltransferase subunit 1 (EFTu-like GTPase family)